MVLGTNANINRLLEKLPQGSLAHILVSRLRKVEQDQWAAIMKDLLISRLEEKKRELIHAQDQASGD